MNYAKILKLVLRYLADKNWLHTGRQTRPSTLSATGTLRLVTNKENLLSLCDAQSVNIEVSPSVIFVLI